METDSKYWSKKRPFATIKIVGKNEIRLYKTDDSYFQSASESYNSLISIEYWRDEQSAKDFITKIKSED